MGLLKLDYCGKTFSRGNTVIHAVRPTVMEIEAGVHLIYGRDGAGKSTLLHMMAGMEPPSDGKIYYEGASVYDALDLPSLYRQDFGFIFPEENLIPEFNVGDNLLMPLRFNRDKERGLFHELVEALELSDMLRMRPQSLSEYEQQRAAVARALLQRPKIVFADDITCRLNEEERDQLMEVLLRLCAKQQVTLIAATNDAELQRYGKTLYRMRDGELTVQHAQGEEK